jgi:hypothetical protein
MADRRRFGLGTGGQPERHQRFRRWSAFDAMSATGTVQRIKIELVGTLSLNVQEEKFRISQISDQVMFVRPAKINDHSRFEFQISPETT